MSGPLPYDWHGAMDAVAADRDATIQQQAAQIAVLREAARADAICAWCHDGYDAFQREDGAWWHAYKSRCVGQQLAEALADPNPEAERLLAERDAGRALYEAICAADGIHEYDGEQVQAAVEAYQKAVKGE